MPAKNWGIDWELLPTHDRGAAYRAEFARMARSHIELVTQLLS